MTYYERNLPHWQPPGKDLFVTWRLSGSLPVTVAEAVRSMGELPDGKRFAEFDRHLDAGNYGPTWMSKEKVAALVVEALRNADSLRLCKIHAYVVMPNHVHVLLEPVVELARITKLIKGGTPVRQTRCLDERESSSGKMNRSIIGSALPPNLSGFARTSKGTRSRLG